MFKLYDRVKETSYTQGAGQLVLRGATAGFVTFGSVYSDQDTFFYTITNNDQYEVGLAKYVSANNSIERIEVFQSTTGSLVVWGKGLKEIYVTYPAEQSVYKDKDAGTSFSGVMPMWGSDNSLVSSEARFVGDTLYSQKMTADAFYGNVIYMNHQDAEIVWGEDEVKQTKAAVELELDSSTRIEEVISNSGYTDHTLGFKVQSPATVFAGPLNDCGGVPCSSDYPSFRPLVAGDIPNINAENVIYNPTTPEDWDTLPTNVKQALDTVAKYDEKYLQRSENLGDLTNVALARFNLGVDGSGSDNSTNVTLTGENYLFISDGNQEITAKKIDVGVHLSGVVPMEHLPFKDEGDFSSNSQEHLPTQQSVKTYVDNSVSDLINSAPEALDTLKELSDALGGDENFATTVASGLGEKLSKAQNLADLTDAEQARANLGVGPSGEGVGEAVWGNMTGDIANQNDLVNYVDLREPRFTKNTAFNTNFGSTNGTTCEGSDPRLSDSRAPTTHTHDDRYYTETEVDALIADSIYQPFLDITEYDNAPNYRYYGGISDATGDWQINRYPKGNLINDDSAASGNNPTFANLSAAWGSRSGLTYA